MIASTKISSEGVQAPIAKLVNMLNPAKLLIALMVLFKSMVSSEFGVPNARLLGKLVRSAGAGEGDGGINKITNIAMAIGIAIVVLMVITYLVGVMGSSLVTGLPNNYPAGSAGYNFTQQTYSNLNKVNSIFGISMTLIQLLIVVGILAIVISFLVATFRNKGA